MSYNFQDGDLMKFSIFKKEEPKEVAVEEYTEIPAEEDTSSKVNIVIDHIEGMIDVDKIIRKVRTGNIVIAKIKDLRDNNMEELKHCISKLKTATANINGDIAGVGEEWIIVTPAMAKIDRTGM